MKYVILGGVFLLNLPLFAYMSRWFFDDLLDCLFFLRFLGMNKNGAELYDGVVEDFVRFIKFLVWAFLCVFLFGAEYVVLNGLFWSDLPAY